MKNIILIISIVLIGLLEGVAQEKLFYSYSHLRHDLEEEWQKDNKIIVRNYDATEELYASVSVSYKDKTVMHFLFNGFDPSSLVHKTVISTKNKEVIRYFQTLLKSDYSLIANNSWKLKDNSVTKFCYQEEQKGYTIFVFSIVEL